MTYLPIQVRTDYSLLQGFTKIDKLIDKLCQLNLSSCCITDYSLSSSVEFYKKCKEKNIKPILGGTFFIREGNSLYDIILLAKNYEGWQDLLKLTARANTVEGWTSPDNRPKTHGYPSLTFEQFAELASSNLIGVIAGESSVLFPHIFNWEAVYIREGEDIQKYQQKNPVQVGVDCLARYKKILPDLYLGLEHNTFSLTPYLNKAYDYLGEKTNTPRVQISNSFYLKESDKKDQQILICGLLKTTLENVRDKLLEQQNYTLYKFFTKNSYHLPLLNCPISLEISDKCEEYDILSPPRLPKISENASEELRQTCCEGWKEKIENKISKDKHKKYSERVHHELKVITEANLSDYFLIVKDICNYARQNKWLVGCGRGSSGGSLVAYLTNITQIDPIKYNLLFERFYNFSRKGSMPDIDLDFPIESREKIIEYMRGKYGKDHTGQICTFQTIHGRNSLKDVLRARGKISFTEMNKITKNIPDPAKVAGAIQTEKEKTGEDSLIKWTLKNRQKELKEWCYLEDNQLKGPLADEFAQAIRLEGTKISIGRHPAGIAISNTPLYKFSPLHYDHRQKEQIIGVDLDHAEKIGHVKYDILGINMLSKMMMIEKLSKEK